MNDIRKGVCPLCNHNKIIHAEPGDMVHGGAFPMALARKQRLFGGDLGNAPLGELHAYACQKCGCTQWFTLHPERVPIDDDYKTELIVGPEPDRVGPYR